MSIANPEKFFIGLVFIVTQGVCPIHAMHQRLAVGIGFKAEGHLPVTVCFHLIGIKGLNGANGIFYLLNHLCTVGTVTG